jgi:replicative DNA helicase
MDTLAARTVPAAVESARVVRGARLRDPDVALPVLDVLPAAAGPWFYRDAHNPSDDAMLPLLERRDPVDVQAVTAVLHRRGSLQRAGGSVEVAELVECVASTVNAPSHARVGREKALLRRLIDIGTAVSALAFAQDEIPYIIGQTSQALLAVANAQAPQAIVDLHTLLRTAITQAQQANPQTLPGISSGFHDLDRLINGFHPSNRLIVAARPAMGKTALGLQFALSACLHPAAPVRLFSLERSPDELASRLLCSEARLDSISLHRGLLTAAEWGQVLEGAERLRELPLLIDDTPRLSVLDIQARARRLQLERGLSLLVSDALPLMRPHRRIESRQQEVSEISGDLKALAKELRVPVIARSQLNRAVEHRRPAIPPLADLRASGAIEQDADLILFISREQVYNPQADGTARLLIAKQRNGPTGEVRLLFQRTYARFEHLAPAYLHDANSRVVA